MHLPAHTDISVVFEPITDQLSLVKALLEKQLAPARRDKVFGKMLESFSVCSGKMLRPGLVLLSGRCFGQITEQHVRVAAILEMIHNATLLHDDVIDEGQRRRGAPTMNSLWGNESAVLLGDFLLSKASVMCAELTAEINKIITAATARVCEGELRQTFQRRNWHLSESEYIDIITDKSASLFSTGCSLGASLAGADEDKVRSLARFGLNTGIAFQITDDLLDIVGDESKAGKTLGRDFDKNKLTLGIIHLLEAVPNSERDSVIDSYLESDAKCDKAALKEMLQRLGSLEYVRRRAQQFITVAIESLSGLESSPAKNALIETAGFVAGRSA